MISIFLQPYQYFIVEMSKLIRYPSIDFLRILIQIKLETTYFTPMTFSPLICTTLFDHTEVTGITVPKEPNRSTSRTSVQRLSVACHWNASILFYLFRYQTSSCSITSRLSRGSIVYVQLIKGELFGHSYLFSTFTGYRLG